MNDSQTMSSLMESVNRLASQISATRQSLENVEYFLNVMAQNLINLRRELEENQEVENVTEDKPE